MSLRRNFIRAISGWENQLRKNKRSQLAAKMKKGLRRGDVTLSVLLLYIFSGRDDGDRDSRECQRRIPLFWRPVVPG